LKWSVLRQPTAIDRLHFAVYKIPCQCLFREDMIVDLPDADYICIGYLRRTLRIGEEVAKGGKPLADCIRAKPPGFGK
jgi:hypothetical protein